MEEDDFVQIYLFQYGSIENTLTQIKNITKPAVFVDTYLSKCVSELEIDRIFNAIEKNHTIRGLKISGNLFFISTFYCKLYF